ncbi:MAG: outer membrane lipoprotein-sorting protein [Nitrospinae bacterium]|nr:outer membrane lipoprotein-sorting protein [Nitrospinota bacterium]
MRIHRQSAFISMVFLLLHATASFAFAGETDPNVLLKAIDDNLWSETKSIEGHLVIDNGRKERELAFDSWLEGREKGYTHYKAPPREAGTKMLKIQDKLWMYTPQTDRKILIAGHLLRQSMMGSDLSYEDMLEDTKLSSAYDAKVEKVEDVDGFPSLVLHLVARDETITYQSRRVWTDPQRKIILREERYAKSGMLLKKVDFSGYAPIKGRLFPRSLTFRDMLKENTHTTYHFDVIEFDVPVPEKYFSLSILKR